MAKYKKVKQKKVAKIGNYMVRTTWEESGDEGVKVRTKAAVKITLKDK